MRAVVFANGLITDDEQANGLIEPGDLIIAADGGSEHCLRLGLVPAAVVGDLDSLSPETSAALQQAGVEFVTYPARKDFTDLELALRHALYQGADEIILLGALGARLDMTAANIMILAHSDLVGRKIRIVDGNAEISLLVGGDVHEVSGRPGDIVSLIPVGGPVTGINLSDLEYPLIDATLPLGSTLGISNVMTSERAEVRLESGLLLCSVIRNS